MGIGFVSPTTKIIFLVGLTGIKYFIINEDYMKRFLAVFFARNLEFFRDRSTFFWNIFFPSLLIFGFAFAFSGTDKSIYKIGTIGKTENKIEFFQYKYLQFIPYDTLDKSLLKLSHHQIDMVIELNADKYYINNENPNGYIVERMLLSDQSQKLQKTTISGQKIRYIDWFVPGVIGMNIIFSCLMGVGFVIVRYRKNGVLKRFKATPLHAFEFIIAQMFSRFFIIAFMSTVIYIGTNFFLHFKMIGSYIDLIIITSAAIVCHISLGLLFSSRFKSEELASGIINIFIWPMVILSGIFFSLEGTPKIMQSASKIFPVTYFIEASRKVMLDGANLFEIFNDLSTLIIMTIIFLIISALIFKWE
jgi:ABC-2 type transport system permease protein